MASRQLYYLPRDSSHPVTKNQVCGRNRFLNSMVDGPANEYF